MRSILFYYELAQLVTTDEISICISQVNSCTNHEKGLINCRLKKKKKGAREGASNFHSKSLLVARKQSKGHEIKGANITGQNMERKEWVTFRIWPSMNLGEKKSQASYVVSQRRGLCKVDLPTQSHLTDSKRFCDLQKVVCKEPSLLIHDIVCDNGITSHNDCVWKENTTGEFIFIGGYLACSPNLCWLSNTLWPNTGKWQIKQTIRFIRAYVWKNVE